jgi:hypothetical protein
MSEYMNMRMARCIFICILAIVLCATILPRQFEFRAEQTMLGQLVRAFTHPIPTIKP